MKQRAVCLIHLFDGSLIHVVVWQIACGYREAFYGFWFARKHENVRKKHDFWFWKDFPKQSKTPFPRPSLEILISRVLLKECRWSPRGGGLRPPPLGDPCILSQPRNSNFEWWPWKGIFFIFFKNRNHVFSGKNITPPPSFFSFNWWQQLAPVPYHHLPLPTKRIV